MQLARIAVSVGRSKVPVPSKRKCRAALQSSTGIYGNRDCGADSERVSNRTRSITTLSKTMTSVVMKPALVSRGCSVMRHSPLPASP